MAQRTYRRRREGAACRSHACTRRQTTRVLACVFAVSAALYAGSASGQTVEQLRALSIEALANIQVTSVSKSTQKLSDAASAIYVISHDDIIRSGATTIPEMLRLAPNLEVAQLNANSYAVSARGFNVGNNAALSNKLLVLIDGRSIYTPLFGGVYWDMQQVLPEDVERIEVISGPGAALWGSNAVNGVVNIITKRSTDTQGGVLTLGGGNLEQMASLQYGGRLGDDLAYRVYAAGYNFENYESAKASAGLDGYTKPDGGFRLDYTPGRDQLTLEGDIFEANEAPNGFVEGRNLTANWQRQLGGDASIQLLAYVDEEGRYVDGGPGFSLNTYDVEFQNNVRLASWNSVVWGVGERYTTYRFENTALQLVPTRQGLNLANLFGQDTISLSESLRLILGLKVESEPYANIEPMPSIRMSWKVDPDLTLWAAVSRAIRSPTPVDENLREFLGPFDILNGSSSFRPEDLIAYEVGTRIQISPSASVSVSGFYDSYDDLRTLDPSPKVYPILFGNALKGHVYGVEIWGEWRVFDWWRLSAGFNIQHEDFYYDNVLDSAGGLSFVADDPNHQASLRSAINLGRDITWDADFRFVGALPHPFVKQYAELNTRIGWKITSRLDVSVSGFNLLHPQHTEFNEMGEADPIPRSFFLQTRWKF